MPENNFCVYKHTSPSGKSYIGQTDNYKRRCGAHKQENNACVAFSFAIKKYGWDSFNHEILEENLTIEEANFWEEFYIKEINSLVPNGYNLRDGGNNSRLSKEIRKKISESRIGKKIHTEISKIKIGESSRNRSQETIEKMSKSAKKRPPVSEETREKISFNSKNISQDTRNKISKANSNPSKEVRDKRIKALTGKKHTEETKAKIGSYHKGKIISEETRAKMKIAAKKRCEIRKLKALAA